MVRNMLWQKLKMADNLFCLTGLITLVLLIWKWMGEEKPSFKKLGLLFSTKLIGVLTLSLLLKLSPKKLEPWFVLWSFFLLKLLCISINLPYGLTWNTVVGMSILTVSFLEQLDSRQWRFVWTTYPFTYFILSAKGCCEETCLGRIKLLGMSLALPVLYCKYLFPNGFWLNKSDKTSNPKF